MDKSVFDRHHIQFDTEAKTQNTQHMKQAL